MSDLGWFQVSPWVEEPGPFGPIARCKVVMLLPDRVLWEYIVLSEDEVRAHLDHGLEALQVAMQRRFDGTATRLRSRAGIVAW